MLAQQVVVVAAMRREAVGGANAQNAHGMNRRGFFGHQGAQAAAHGMFFQRGETALVARIEARIARLVNWPLENGEGLQILQYRPGAEYKPHYDYFDPAEPGTPTILKRGGQRVGTLVMYLSEPEKGGGTVFPDIHLEVAPKRGHGVFFHFCRRKFTLIASQAAKRLIRGYNFRVCSNSGRVQPHVHTTTPKREKT